LTRRVAIVTGGTRGLGGVLSAALVERDVIVAAAYRRDEAAARSLKDQCGDRLHIHQMDLTDADACKNLVEQVVATHGSLDYLVNNAGAVHESKIQDIIPEAWNNALALNLSGAFFMSQAALGPMRNQRFGRIVNVSSVSSTMGTPYQADYAAAKGGLVGLTRSLARAAARSSVTVNCLVLGGFETELLKDLTLTSRSVVEAAVPVGRFGRPEEFAHAVLSLLDDRASYITGAILTVDGGLSMGG